MLKVVEENTGSNNTNIRSIHNKYIYVLLSLPEKIRKMENNEKGLIVYGQTTLNAPNLIWKELARVEK